MRKDLGAFEHSGLVSLPRQHLTLRIVSATLESASLAYNGLLLALNIGSLRCRNPSRVGGEADPPLPNGIAGRAQSPSATAPRSGAAAGCAPPISVPVAEPATNGFPSRIYQEPPGARRVVEHNPCHAIFLIARSGRGAVPAGGVGAISGAVSSAVSAAKYASFAWGDHPSSLPTGGALATGRSRPKVRRWTDRKLTRAIACGDLIPVIAGRHGTPRTSASSCPGKDHP
jgi:hypothetical protein